MQISGRNRSHGQVALLLTDFETTLPAAAFRFFVFQIVTRTLPERVGDPREKNPIAGDAGASYGWFLFFEEP
jgi:hypothetical protein